jgi:hypothetical protein
MTVRFSVAGDARLRRVLVMICAPFGLGLSGMWRENEQSAGQKEKGAHGPLSGSSGIDGGNRVIDIGARNCTIVVFDNDLTVGLNVADGAEAEMFRGVRRPPLNAFPYYRIFFC